MPLDHGRPCVFALGQGRLDLPLKGLGLSPNSTFPGCLARDSLQGTFEGRER
jgi:hypothetical protein